MSIEIQCVYSKSGVTSTNDSYVFRPPSRNLDGGWFGPSASSGTLSLITYCLLTTVYFPLPTSYFLLPTSHFPLPTSYFPLPTSYFLLPTSYFLLPTSYFLLPTSYFPLNPSSICWEACVVLLFVFVHADVGFVHGRADVAAIVVVIEP